MKKKKSSRIREKNIKDIRLLRPLIAYVQRYHSKTKPPPFIKTKKGETNRNYALAIMGLNYAGIIIQDSNAPKRLRNHAEQVIERAYEAVCLDFGGPPRIGISLYEMDFGSYRRLIQEISKTFRACRKIWRAGESIGIEEQKPLINWIRTEVNRGMPAAPDWESAVKISVNKPWKGKQEITVILDILAALTGRERASVGGEKKKFDQYLEGLDRELARMMRTLKRNK